MATAMKEETQERPSLRLTAACWPVFEFLINFARQVKRGAAPAPDQVRYEAVSAIRDAEDLARNDSITERAWNDRVKAMMVYLIDYKMLNSPWDGIDFWFNNRMETDPEVLNQVESLGGEKFFGDCDEIQKEYEMAERRDRKDKDELAEQLSLYFSCLRLGFKGQYHDRPQELDDYTRRLFSRLPAYATTRSREMFPETYKHNQELKVDYKLGASLTVVLVIFFAVIGLALAGFRVAWEKATGRIQQAAQDMENVRADQPAAPSAAVGTGQPAPDKNTKPASQPAKVVEEEE